MSTGARSQGSPTDKGGIHSGSQRCSVGDCGATALQRSRARVISEGSDCGRPREARLIREGFTLG